MTTQFLVALIGSMSFSALVTIPLARWCATHLPR
ncbi:putative FMN-binding regulatory protein PaiB [Sphingomonas melonis]|uniref:Putative FMN-binding regulatory protein PaiB n=1 Tax=Sphingomonas melonis TaxID=152682 RepID=A0A7Y9K386_9SPHN|nr:putative FMN-binding regulatory protein PaiB [Sphingomonas melonis]